MYERFVGRRAEEALADTAVVLIVGPRRAGKTTLVRKVDDADGTYITLDEWRAREDKLRTLAEHTCRVACLSEQDTPTYWYLRSNACSTQLPKEDETPRNA